MKEVFLYLFSLVEGALLCCYFFCYVELGVFLEKLKSVMLSLSGVG